MQSISDNAYPVGIAVGSIFVIVAIIMSLMWTLNKNPATETVATPPVVISLFMVLTFITVTIYATLKEIPETKTGELLLGALISTFTVVITYWFARNMQRPPDDRSK